MRFIRLSLPVALVAVALHSFLPLLDLDWSKFILGKYLISYHTEIKVKVNMRSSTVRVELQPPPPSFLV